MTVCGEGHIHYFMYASAPTARDGPAVTGPGTWTASSSTSYTWKNVSQGLHNFSAELVNNDRTPLRPPAVESVNVMVTESK